MKSLSRIIIFIVLIVGILQAQQPLSAPDSAHASYMAETASMLSELDEAIAANEMLINNYPNSDFTPTVMYQLMELHYRKAVAIYNHEMTKYEEALDQYDKGRLSVQPALPQVSYEPTIQRGIELLNAFPTADFLDKVLYRIAFCYFESGEKMKSVEYFSRLIANHPDSEYKEEARFRLGEIHFENHQYEEAAAIYSNLLLSYDGPFFNMALYKLGWSYYNTNQYDKAISAFIFLIDDLSQAAQASKDSLKGESSDLREEAITYVAECFAELGGAKIAERFLENMGEKEYSGAIFIRLGELYEERNFYEEASQTYELMLKIWPFAPRAPETQEKIVQGYVRAANKAQADKARDVMVATYSPGSEWSNKFPVGEFHDKAIELVSKNLYILATDAQANARENNSEQDYKVALARYMMYLEKFPDTEDAPKVQYYQAECFYELGDFVGASAAYEKVMINYPLSEFAAMAGYNRVIAAINIMDKAGKVQEDSSSIVLTDFIGTKKKATVTIPNHFYADLIHACNDFARVLPKDEKLPEVMMKYGEALFELGYFKLAADAYKMVLNRGEDNPYNLAAISMIAQSYYKNGDYMISEGWYRRITREYPDSVQYVDNAKNMVASAKFKIADKLREEGNVELASRALAVIASTSDNVEVAEKAIIQSATGYEESGNLRKAIILLENLRHRFPDSEQVDKSLLKAAQLSEKLGDNRRAAQDYLELVEIRPNSKFASTALYSAAVCYENLGDNEKAAELYDSYAATYKDDPGKRVEAMCKSGEASFKREDFKRAKEIFESVIRMYNKAANEGEMLDEYYVAQAHFMLGEMYFNHYLKIRLVEPLQKNISRKDAALQAVVKAYNDAATYQVADWKTAALHKLGEAFEEYAHFWWSSERPEGLDATQMASYEATLKGNKVEPYQLKAVEFYRSNIKLGEENNIQNDWIMRSRTRLVTLENVLGMAQASGQTATDFE
ncbi:MAG: tetratricopeptide repeat protein [Deferribacteres bacterium]|nr:tetratricopeptide repeat protein [candidate division KSB1 bacterium]MCB9503978.1 tetratricopeptide repeat protein [Deferribacteres bacterium]